MEISEEKKTFEVIMTEKFPKLMSDTKPPIQESRRTPNAKQKQQKSNPNKLHPGMPYSGANNQSQDWSRGGNLPTEKCR